MAQFVASSNNSTSRTRSHIIYPPVDLPCEHFVGKELELNGLVHAFSNNEPAITSRAAVWGMPGLGKTQLALKYIVSEYASHYSHIFWISSATIVGITEGRADILELLGLPERHDLEQPSKVAAVRRWLEDEGGENPRTWLLVFDNATEDTVSTLRELFPTNSLRGNVLFTSRSKAVASALTSANGEEHYCH